MSDIRYPRFPARMLNTSQPGLPSDNEILSRLPDAELAGMYGPGVVPPGYHQQVGARPGTDVQDKLNTYRPLAGAPENNRGGSVIIDPADAVFSGAGNSDPIRKLVVESPRNAGDDAEALAVILGRSVVNQALGPGGDGREVKALLEWGVGGAFYQALVDWGRGGVIVVPAAFMRVSVNYVVQGPPFFGNPPIEAFAASIAYGYAGRGKANAAKHSTRVDVAPLGGTLDIEIPAFATHVGFISIHPVDVTFFGTTTITVTNSLTVQYTGATNASEHGEDSFVIPEFADSIRLTNNDPVTIARVGVIFGLSL
jgi:hypothetical protein